MHGLDIAALGETIAIVIGGVISLLLISLAGRRAVAILRFPYKGRNRNNNSAAVSLLFLIAGAAYTLYVWPSNKSYKWYISAVLVGIGVLMTLLIHMPRVRRDGEDLGDHAERHLRRAWPWRSRAVLTFGLIAIAVIGYSIYHGLLRNR